MTPHELMAIGIAVAVLGAGFAMVALALVVAFGDQEPYAVPQEDTSE